MDLPDQRRFGPPSDELLPDLLARASLVVHRELAEELRRHGLSVAEWRALSALAGTAAGRPVSAVASACLMQQPTMTKLLDRMARAGLVVRTPDAEDRRIVRIALTPAGRAKARAATTSAVRYEGRLLADCPGARQIKEALRRAPALLTSAGFVGEES